MSSSSAPGPGGAAPPGAQLGSPGGSKEGSEATTHNQANHLWTHSTLLRVSARAVVVCCSALAECKSELVLIMSAWLFQYTDSNAN